MQPFNNFNNNVTIGLFQLKLSDREFRGTNGRFCTHQNNNNPDSFWGRSLPHPPDTKISELFFFVVLFNLSLIKFDLIGANTGRG